MADTTKAPRQRADQLVHEQGLAPSREKARALILAGQVLADNRPVAKAGELVTVTAELRLRGEVLPFVSRGGLKLDHALKTFNIDVARRVCADFGASTGGFTDCLLQRGATHVHAIDVGHGQLAEKLRQDPRVTVRDRFNVRHIEPGTLDPLPTFFAADLSFISLRLVLSALFGACGRPVDFVVLVKPQFEVGREAVGKGGIVRDDAARARALADVTAACAALGATDLRSTTSPITGRDGNVEFLLAGRVAEPAPNGRT